MCKWHGGTFEGQLPVKLSWPRGDGVDTVYVDPCIQHLVQALNDAGMQTLSSCCGHGTKPGWIALEDGRQLLITDFATAKRIVDKEVSYSKDYHTVTTRDENGDVLSSTTIVTLTD